LRPQSPYELRTLLGEVRAALDANRQVNLPCDRKVVEPGRAAHWDFASFLAAKLKGFTGRKWLFQEIDEWRAKGPQPALLIIGETGIGKSAIVAALVHENPDGQVLAYHCCRADTPATLEPAGFVRSVVAMFAARLDD